MQIKIRQGQVTIEVVYVGQTADEDRLMVKAILDKLKEA